MSFFACTLCYLIEGRVMNGSGWELLRFACDDHFSLFALHALLASVFLFSFVHLLLLFRFDYLLPDDLFHVLLLSFLCH